ncbi:MAG: hypothetical protein HC843_08610 [Sphingomonadales bacterium]|nr:hypothetical protein [Sphingomonadales bacterium]
MNSALSKIIVITLLSLATLFGVGVLTGMWVAHMEEGGGVPNGKFIALALLFAAITLACIWLVSGAFTGCCKQQTPMLNR